MNKVLQGYVWLLLWPHGRMLVYPSDTRDRPGGGIRQTSISLDKLLDRVVQHAELIYRVSEESCLQFEENFIPLSDRSQQIQGGDLCLTKAFAIPGSKGEIQQTSDRWLLNSVLILIQSWIEPLVNLLTTLDRYDNAPISLLNKTKWVSHKLTSLEQGVLVIMRMILGEGTSIPEHLQRLADNNKQPEQAESVLRDYALLTCFKKDAHKIDTFLKLLNCRQTNKTSCFLP